MAEGGEWNERSGNGRDGPARIRVRSGWKSLRRGWLRCRWPTTTLPARIGAMPCSGCSLAWPSSLVTSSSAGGAVALPNSSAIDSADRTVRRDWLLPLVVAGIALAVCVVVLGAYTRLVDAGLGCPDWPGCYGLIGRARDAGRNRRCPGGVPGRAGGSGQGMARDGASLFRDRARCAHPRHSWPRRQAAAAPQAARHPHRDGDRARGPLVPGP